jgi:hypothetical protein
MPISAAYQYALQSADGAAFVDAFRSAHAGTNSAANQPAQCPAYFAADSAILYMPKLSTQFLAEHTAQQSPFGAACRSTYIAAFVSTDCSPEFGAFDAPHGSA